MKIFHFWLVFFLTLPLVARSYEQSSAFDLTIGIQKNYGEYSGYFYADIVSLTMPRNIHFTFQGFNCIEVEDKNVNGYAVKYLYLKEGADPAIWKQHKKSVDDYYKVAEGIYLQTKNRHIPIKKEIALEKNQVTFLQSAVELINLGRTFYNIQMFFLTGVYRLTQDQETIIENHLKKHLLNAYGFEGIKRSPFKIEIETEKESIEQGEPLTLMISLKNTSKESLLFCVRNTPFADKLSVLDDCFYMFHNNQSIQLPTHQNRVGRFKPMDFDILGSGKTRCKKIVVFQDGSMPSVGNYYVTYINNLYFIKHKDSLLKNHVTDNYILHSNTVTIRVNPKPVRPKLDTGFFRLQIRYYDSVMINELLEKCYFFRTTGTFEYLCQVHKPYATRQYIKHLKQKYRDVIKTIEWLPNFESPYRLKKNG